ncbi:LysE family translocator [Hyalangium sp.]|uniref:LysE family translocator n=1 Tax=Hyalangium sp. TaxID=2028555 RepID=UPI002D49D589|nr:LysE family transporter [Hyalangium sp.]HYI01542.1 LysE family transporter [Hyalangium sp.]
MAASFLILVPLALAHLVAVASPGPSFLIVAQTSARHSWRLGVHAAIGMAIGALVWALAALLGLGALFLKFTWLYGVVRLAGGVFLLWVAFQIWRHSGDPLEMAVQSEGETDGRRVLLSALRVQLSNPKPAVFYGSIFVALLPPETPLSVKIAALCIITLNEFLWYSFVAVALSRQLVRQAYLRWKAWIDRITAGVLGFLGIRLIAEGNS